MRRRTREQERGRRHRHTKLMNREYEYKVTPEHKNSKTLVTWKHDNDPFKIKS